MKLGRKPKGMVAIGVAIATVISTFAIAPSLASWTDTEYDHGAVSPLNCAAAGTYTTNAWGQEVAGSVGTTQLDPNLAGVLGVTTTSGVPASTATGGAGSTGLNNLGDDAWSNTLNAGALNAVSLGLGVALPLGQNLGAETQYARATSTGVATGASGVLTSAGGGLVSLTTPTSTTPSMGSISLDSALSAIVGTKLSTDVTQLADASLTVGALGSTSQLDSCNALWQAKSDAASVVRSYVLAKLGLTFDSSLIGTATSTAVGSVNTITKTSNATLASALNALPQIGAVTGPTLSTVTSTLNGLLPSTGSGLDVSLAPTTVQVGVTFDPSTMLNDLNTTLTSGPVSIDLATGEIDADLAGLGSTNLNTLAPNSPLITTTLLNNLKTAIGAAITNFMTTKLGPDLTTTLNAAAVTVDIETQIALDLPVIGQQNVATLSVIASGTLGQFLQPTTFGNPVVSVNTAVLNTLGVAGALSLLGLNLGTILGTVTSGLGTAVSSRVLPLVDTAVLTPLLTAATTAVTNSVATLTASLDGVVTSLGGVVDVIGDVVQLTVNAEPDQPNAVGYPQANVPGRFFESALKVGVLNGVGGTSVLSLYLGSSSVGPNVEN